jgi:hypothetical protein
MRTRDAVTAPNALRRRAEAVALSDIAGSAHGGTSEADARRFAADARDLMAVLRAVLRLHRRWHSQSYGPLIRLLRKTAAHVESAQRERDSAFKALARRHLRVVSGGKLAQVG